PVGFVEYEVLEARQPGVPRPEMIEQAAARANNDVEAAAESVLLRSDADAAIHRRRRDRRVDGQITEVCEDLRRELPRGRQHECARRPTWPANERVENRQQERSSLAAAGHRRRQEIAPFER